MYVPCAHRLAIVALGLAAGAGCTEGAAPTTTTTSGGQALTRAAAPEDVVWTRRAAEGEGSPPRRMFHGLAFDPEAKRTVLFGGTTSGDVDGVLADTWTWDGTSWTELQPPRAPSARFGFDMVYSTVHEAIVLYGGAAQDAAGDYEPQGDTWTWNGTTWAELPRGTTSPPPLAGHSMAFDSGRGVVVLFGGLGDEDNEDVWELGGGGWQNRGQAASSPGSLDAFVMTYDDRLERTVVFGGTSPAGIPVPEAAVDATYTWDGAVWNRVTGEGPSARSGSAGAFDTRRGRTMIFGGTTFEGFDTDETWEFAAGEWELREPLRKPTALSNAELAYDSARDRVVSFGGYTFFAEGETWEYLHFGSACRTAAECDGYPCVDGVCCKVATCGTCERCSADAGKCEPIRGADDVNGGCSGGKTCSAEGVCLSRGGAPGCTADTECASGHCADGVCCDAACTGACESCAVTGKAGSCTLVTGEAAHGSCPGSGLCASACTGASADCVFPGTDVDCGTSCSDATLTLRTCDGRGGCRAGTALACGEHLACAGEAACAERCEDASDCASGFVCLRGACVDPAPGCADVVTASGPAGPEDCRPYRCEDGGCKTTCRTAGDCAPGLLCNRAGNCIADPGAVPGEDGGTGEERPVDQSGGAADSGCGCRLGAPPAAGGGSAAALAALVALALRRSRARS